MKCELCGKDGLKNLAAHKRWCKGKPNVKVSTYEIPDKKPSLLSRLLRRKPKVNPREYDELETEDFEDILKRLPKWSIRKRKPLGKPKNENVWVQFVGFSRTRPPIQFWTEYDGVTLTVGDMTFPTYQKVTGDIFAYDMDKGIPLLDNSEEFNDQSFWSKQMHRTKNIYFMLGLHEGSPDIQKNLGLILLLVAGLGVLGLVNLFFTYQLGQGLEATGMQLNNATVMVRDYISTHP